jgi:hypothetical protein
MCFWLKNANQNQYQKLESIRFQAVDESMNEDRILLMHGKIGKNHKCLNAQIRSKLNEMI